jgi:hypothetical protein
MMFIERKSPIRKHRPRELIMKGFLILCNQRCPRERKGGPAGTREGKEDQQVQEKGKEDQGVQGKGRIFSIGNDLKIKGKQHIIMQRKQRRVKTESRH